MLDAPFLWDDSEIDLQHILCPSSIDLCEVCGVFDSKFAFRRTQRPWTMCVQALCETPCLMVVLTRKSYGCLKVLKFIIRSRCVVFW